MSPVEFFLLFSFFTLIFFIYYLSQKIVKQSEINQQQAKDIQEIKERILLSSQFQDNLKEWFGKNKRRD
jgi:Na+/H+ antiporter NhaD/arsenite permease-like protein